MNLPAGDALASAFVAAANQPLAAERAWQQCFAGFGLPDDGFDEDHAALLLSFHLAGSGSFQTGNGLRRYGAAVLLPIVRIARSAEWASLRALPLAHVADASERIVSLAVALKDAVAADAPDVKLGAALLSKILLATLGCVPAYQRLQLKGARARGWRATFAVQGIATLAETARDDDDFRRFYATVEHARLRMADGSPYPPLRLLDAYLHQLGEEVVRIGKEQGMGRAVA